MSELTFGRQFAVSRRRHAAVDHELRARHVAGRVGSEEQHAVCDVLRLSSPAERHTGSGDLVRIRFVRGRNW